MYFWRNFLGILVIFKWGVLKNKNNELINTVKNTDYERNMFLYELGFTNLKRVREFISTMNTVGNIENYNKVAELYSKYKLELLNNEMLEIVKKEFGFKQEPNDKFDSFIPNVAIDNLKTNYELLESNKVVYNLYRRYYLKSNKEIVLFEEAQQYINRNFNALKKAMTATSSQEKEVYELGSNYYSIQRKKISVCYNNTKGMILLEVEPNYHMVISEWSDADGNKLDKLNFKEFIKNEL